MSTNSVAVLSLLCLWGAAFPALAAEAKPKGGIFARFDQEDAQHPPREGGVVITGASTAAGWARYQDGLGVENILNRGCSGTKIPFITGSLERLVAPYKPKVVIFYSGDNDIGGGASAEKVLESFKALHAALRARLPDTWLLLLSVKPSPGRWQFLQVQKDANQLVKDYCSKEKGVIFVDIASPMLNTDGTLKSEYYPNGQGIHINAKGYELWNSIVKPELTKLLATNP